MKRKHKRSFEVLSSFNYYVPDWSGIIILLIWLLVGALFGNLITILLNKIAGGIYAEYSVLLAYPVMFIPAMMYAASRSRSDAFFVKGCALDSNHFGNLSGALCALLVVMATFTAGFVADLFCSFLPAMPDFLKEALESMTSGKLWLNILSVSIMAPFFEEWLCRGMVERGLLQRIKPVWAIVISALFFAIIHANPWQAVPAFILGCLFGYVYYKTGSLKLTMLMHCANNTLSVVLSRVDSLKDLGDIECWKNVLPAKQYWVIFAACVLFLMLFIKVFRNIELQSEKGNCDVVNPGVEIS